MIVASLQANILETENKDCIAQNYLVTVSFFLYVVHAVVSTERFISRKCWSKKTFMKPRGPVATRATAKTVLIHQTTLSTFLSRFHRVQSLIMKNGGRKSPTRQVISKNLKEI